MATERLTIELEAKNRASKELKAVSKDIKKMEGDYGSASDEIKSQNRGLISSMRSLGGVIAGAFVVNAAVRFGKEMYEIGTQMELLDKKANTVFGDMKGMVEDFAETSAAAMGLTQREYIDSAAKIGDLLIPMKFARDEAAAMSVDLVDLSGALAEWTGGQRTAAEVSDILAKAMLGEREGLKALGISISEEDVKLRAHHLLVEEGLQLSEQQARAQATLELMYEKSTDAQEAFRNGGDSLYRQQVQLQATLKETKETIAVALLPTFQETTAAVLENVQAVLQDEDTMNNLTMTMQGLGEVIQFVTQGIFGFTKAIGDAMGHVAGFIAAAQQAAEATNVSLGFSKSTSANVNYLTADAQARAKELGIEYRASGGPVTGGKPYIVGEQGPELYVPNNSGMIVPNDKMGGVINLNLGGVVINKDMDIKILSERLVQEIQRAKKNFNLGVANV